MNMNEIKVVENTNFYDKMADYVEFAVSSSYGEDGRYHQYRNDFAKAVAIISMCTNYDSNDFTFKDVMEFTHSPEWDLIRSELGYKYDEFIKYVDAEVAYKNAPMREIDTTAKEFRDVIAKVAKVLSAINVDALDGYDFTELFKVIDKVEEHTEEKDNVVPITEFVNKKDN